MKRLAACALAVALLGVLSACGQKADSFEIPPLTEPFASEPVLVTSAGQSIDAEIVSVMLEKEQIPYVMDNNADSLGEAKTLILAVGGSRKGQDAVGRTPDEELARIDRLTADAKQKGASVIAMHIGGKARRGELSDRFLAPSLEAANYVLIVQRSDYDHKISQMVSQLGIPMDASHKMVEAMPLLKAAFVN